MYQKQKMTHMSHLLFVNQVDAFLDRTVPPARGAPWSYTEHHIQHCCRNGITFPPLTRSLYPLFITLK